MNEEKKNNLFILEDAIFLPSMKKLDKAKQLSSCFNKQEVESLLFSSLKNKWILIRILHRYYNDLENKHVSNEEFLDIFCKRYSYSRNDTICSLEPNILHPSRQYQ